jgi:hypothetical protein
MERVTNRRKRKRKREQKAHNVQRYKEWEQKKGRSEYRERMYMNPSHTHTLSHNYSILSIEIFEDIQQMQFRSNPFKMSENMNHQIRIRSSNGNEKNDYPEK